MDITVTPFRRKLGTTARLIHRDPILVCGAPRTGTSWTAKVLSLAGNVRYIREPLSNGGYSARAHLDGFQYLLADDESPEHEAVWRKVLSLNPFLVRRWLMEYSGLWLHRTPFWPARLLVKEVNCPLALDWLAARFHFQIVVTIRHPCGYVASGLRLQNVGHEVIDLDTLLAQPKLMANFTPEDREWINSLVDPVARMAAGFGIVYKILSYQLARHPEWTLVYHTNMCLEPHNRYHQLCKTVGLTPNRRMNTFLDTCTTTPDDALYSLNRVSKEQPYKWKTEQRVSRSIRSLA